MVLRLTVIFFVLSSFDTLRAEYFNYSCELNSPRRDSLFPVINLESIELQVSHRVSHQLVTRIFSIFLSQIYQYDKVNIVNNNKPNDYDEKTNEYVTLNYLHHCETAGINLEVWIPPDSHLLFPDRAFAGGSLSDDLMSYGLFIPESFGSKTYSYKDFISNSSNYQSIIKDFKVNKADMQRIVIPNVEVSEEFDGVYMHKRCVSGSEPCATVLASHYSDMKFFIDHVNELHLRMIVYFLGDRLPQVIKNLQAVNSNANLTSKIQPTKFLVLHWTVSEIINGKTKYLPIEMPKCEVYKTEKNSCRYNLISVSTYFNDKAKKSDDLIEIMKKFHFPSIRPILDVYQSFSQSIENIFNEQKVHKDEEEEIREKVENIYNQVACKWLQKNPNVYQIDHEDSWIKLRDADQEISIGGIFPKDNTGKEFRGIIKAVEMAKDLINRSGMLSNYKLSVKRFDTPCEPDLVLKNFINYYSHREHLIGVLGPSCSEAVESIAAISKHFKMSVITYSAEGISFKDRDQFPYFFRTIGETKQYEDVYTKMLNEFDWKRLAALTEDGTTYTKYITNMGTSLKEINIDLISNMKFTREKDKEKQFANFKKILQDLKDQRAHIIIAHVHDHVLLKSIMCAASKLEMTAQSGYAWFLPVYVSMKINDTLTSGMDDISKECSEAEVRNALNFHFALSYASFGDDGDVIEGNQTIRQWKEQYLNGSPDGIQFADYAGFTYDAIWVYAKSIQQLIYEDVTLNKRYMSSLSSDSTMDRLATLINEMSFQGVSGKIEFNSEGSRFTDVNILQWQQNDFVQVGMYKPIIENRTFVKGDLKMNSRISFPKGIPTDGRENCELKWLANFFKTDCHTVRTFLIIVFCILIVLACSGSSFLFWKRKYDEKMKETKKNMNNIERILIGFDLSKWEIPRENVVLNRKLGEGAFGTVYGGEAMVSEDGGWTAVAIKTLKAGSTAENRLDFLAESETMKRFEHKNIVKLLAVCLQSEPLYTVMEFMLYGDLKTYLLARRQLVYDRLSDDSDISSKRLTNMAMDVARGLSYLASMKYVHRDIACRNCMINAQRVVKLGDFGMARPMFENEYYRFIRKGMLPIRWMSPESIDGGLFSHASDIWSYGVLLYEIVTLGAFPFQGMSNNQVFDYVKQGNSIKIPTKCKPHLKALMSSCFNIDPSKRPGASTIVEFISNSPRMLSPCMDDVPKPNLDDQVNLIDSDNEQLERFEQIIIDRDRSNTPANNIDFLRTSVSSSALQNHSNNHFINHQDPSSFEYLEMRLPRKPNGICLRDFQPDHPDLTASLPNGGNYNPVEPLLQVGTRPEISKSNLSLMKYMPMCGGFGKNSNRSSSPDECTSAI